MKKGISWGFAALLLALTLTGCNTLQGMGQDLQASGRALDRAIN